MQGLAEGWPVCLPSAPFHCHPPRGGRPSRAHAFPFPPATPPHQEWSAPANVTGLSSGASSSRKPSLIPWRGPHSPHASVHGSTGHTMWCLLMSLTPPRDWELLRARASVSDSPLARCGGPAQSAEMEGRKKETKKRRGEKAGREGGQQHCAHSAVEKTENMQPGSGRARRPSCWLIMLSILSLK